MQCVGRVNEHRARCGPMKSFQDFGHSRYSHQETICAYICIYTHTRVYIYVYTIGSPPTRSTFQWFSCPEESDGDGKSTERTAVRLKRTKNQQNMRPHLEGLWTMVSESFVFWLLVCLYLFVLFVVVVCVWVVVVIDVFGVFGVGCFYSPPPPKKCNVSYTTLHFCCTVPKQLVLL